MQPVVLTATSPSSSEVQRSSGLQDAPTQEYQDPIRQDAPTQEDQDHIRQDNMLMMYLECKIVSVGHELQDTPMQVTEPSLIGVGGLQETPQATPSTQCGLSSFQGLHASPSVHRGLSCFQGLPVDPPMQVTPLMQREMPNWIMPLTPFIQREMSNWIMQQPLVPHRDLRRHRRFMRGKSLPGGQRLQDSVTAAPSSDHGLSLSAAAGAGSALPLRLKSQAWCCALAGKVLEVHAADEAEHRRRKAEAEDRRRKAEAEAWSRRLEALRSSDMEVSPRLRVKASPGLRGGGEGLGLRGGGEGLGLRGGGSEEL